MSTDPKKTFDAKQREQESSSSWSWNPFGSSVKAPRSATILDKPSSTNPTTPARSALPRLNLSTPSASVLPTDNGFIPVLSSSQPNDIVGDRLTSPPMADSNSTAQAGGGYTTKGPSVTGSTSKKPGNDAGILNQVESFKSPWKNSSAFINGAGKRHLLGPNSGSPTSSSRQPPVQLVGAIPNRSYRYYSSKSGLLVQKRDPTRASSQRSLQDPELFRRVLSDPKSQQSFKRIIDAGAPKRSELSFDRFLPQRALGANQSGSRVPLSDQHSEPDEESDGPPHKRARKVTFEESAGRSSTWNARKTPMPKFKSRFESSTYCQPQVDEEDLIHGFMSSEACPQPVFANYPCEPPYNFRTGGDPIHHSSFKESPQFRFVQNDQQNETASILFLQLFGDNAMTDNFDEAMYLQQRDELASALDKREAEQLSKNIGSDTPPKPWKCSDCGTTNPDDESQCTKCRKWRAGEIIQEGFVNALFNKTNHEFTWKCSVCSSRCRETDIVCPACSAARSVDSCNATAAAVPRNEQSRRNEHAAINAGGFTFGTQTGQSSSSNTGDGGFSFGLKSTALSPVPTNTEAVTSGIRFGEQDTKQDEHGQFGHLASQGKQDLTKSTTGGFVFGAPKTNATTNTVVPFASTGIFTKSNTSDKDSMGNDSSNQLKPFPSTFAQSLSQTPPDVTGRPADSSDSAPGSGVAFGFNAPAPVAPFTFGTTEVALAQSSAASNTLFKFGQSPADTNSSASDSKGRIAPIEFGGNFSDGNQSKKPRSFGKLDSGDMDGSIQNTPLTVFAAPTKAAEPFSFGTHSSGTQSNDSGLAVGPSSSTPLFALGSTAPIPSSGETAAFSTSSKPAFTFGSSDAAVRSSVTATPGFGVNAPTAPSPAPVPTSAALAPGNSTPFTFGSATLTSAAFTFSSASSGVTGTTNTPGPPGTGFSSLGATDILGNTAPSAAPASGFSFGSSVGSAPTVPFGVGMQSSTSNPTTFGFANSSSSALPIQSFGAGPDPFSSRPSPAPGTGFAATQFVPPMTSTPVGHMQFGAPLSTPVGNGFGNVSNMGTFGGASTSNISGGIGGGFGHGDVMFSIGTGGGTKGSTSKSGRRFVRAKRPGR